MIPEGISHEDLIGYHFKGRLYAQLGFYVFFWNLSRPVFFTLLIFILFLFWKNKYVILRNNPEMGYDSNLENYI